jgi:fructose-specific phosphotransferase system IIB component
MIIAMITACSVGIASTYMAAEALENAAKKRGHQPYVETQGSIGVENEIPLAICQKADIVIFANDIAIQKKGRFAGKIIIEVGVAEAIHKADKIIQMAEERVNKK